MAVASTWLVLDKLLMICMPRNLKNSIICTFTPLMLTGHIYHFVSWSLADIKGEVVALTSCYKPLHPFCTPPIVIWVPAHYGCVVFKRVNVCFIWVICTDQVVYFSPVISQFTLEESQLCMFVRRWKISKDYSVKKYWHKNEMLPIRLIL